MPWLGRISGTLTSGLLVMTVMVIMLYWLDRLTEGWTRRRALGVVVLVLAQAAVAAASADQWIEVIAAGAVGGALATLIYATVLRFDLRIAPALIAVYLVVGFVGDAAQKQTSAGGDAGAHRLRNCAGARLGRDALSLASRRDERSAGRGRLTPACRLTDRSYCTFTQYGMTWLSAR